MGNGISGKKVGLALGSGSARGWSHIGVIRALREAGVEISVVTGTSMGALVAGAYAAGFIDALDEWVRNLTWPEILGFMDVTLPRAGLIEGDRLTNYLRERMTDLAIEDLPMPFAAVATELNTGREIWLDKGSLMNAIRASMSMPGILTPFQHEGRWMVDGGLVNPIPVNLCRHLGASVVIAVNLNSDIMGRRFLSRSNDNRTDGRSYLPRRLAEIINGRIKPRQVSLFRRFVQEQPERGPSVIQVIAKSVYIMQDRITKQRLAADPPDILISPHLAHIGLLEFNRAEESIEEGYRATKLIMPLLEDIMEGP
ncbi:MAG: patatin-like phospholipase RssA [Syntrophales bacterium]|nr:patatin-like phospholipase RssA [Syntrophales bacterium]